MLLTQILAQSNNDDSSAMPALIAFLVVMTIVIVAIALVRRSTRRELDAESSDAGQNELLRQRSLEEKMRRVEERLRDSAVDDQTPPPDDPSEL